VRDRELGYTCSCKSRLVNPEGETTGEFGMCAADNMLAISGSQKGKKQKECNISASMESCASAFREGMDKLSQLIGTVGYYLAHDSSQIALWRPTVITQIEERITVGGRRGDTERLAWLQKLLN